MDDLGQRQARAAERILGDERLTDNLDDEAAQVLLDWGLTCTEEIVRQGASLKDEAEEEWVARRLQAVRRMMRRVNDWASPCGEKTTEKTTASLAPVIEQMETIYGHDLPPPDDEYWSELLNYCDELGATPKRAISLLRTLVMGQSSGSTETEPHG